MYLPIVSVDTNQIKYGLIIQHYDVNVLFILVNLEGFKLLQVASLQLFLAKLSNIALLNLNYSNFILFIQQYQGGLWKRQGVDQNERAVKLNT